MINIPCKMKGCYCGSRTDYGYCLNEVPCIPNIYDKIRALNEEEMAKFLCELKKGYEGIKLDTEKDILDWLLEGDYYDSDVLSAS